MRSHLSRPAPRTRAHRRLAGVAVLVGLALLAEACGNGAVSPAGATSAGAASTSSAPSSPAAPPPSAPSPALAPAGAANGNGKAPYTLDDLTALEQQRGWTELVDHLDDIPPAQRAAPWQGLAERGSVGLLTTLATDKEPFAAVAAADALTKRFPTLTSSASFMAKRAEVGLEAFKVCYQRSHSGAACTDRLIGYVQADPDNTALAMAAGRLIVVNQFPYVAVRAFKLAVVGKTGRARECADPELKRALRAAESSLPKGDPITVDAKQLRLACAKQ
jgi:hypothetical protein